jgi:hypothetical protein
LDEDERYRNLLLEPIRKCADYTPKFGQAGVGLTLERFQVLYGGDPLYSWIGLDSPLMYAAHKAAGGMTSVYRQLGIGCERLFRALLQDGFGLNQEQATWKYVTLGAAGKDRVLALDGRIDLEHVKDAGKRDRVASWLHDMQQRLDVQTEIRGAVFEVRQGYKSKDSKRQNADLANAAQAYTQRYMPVLAVMSAQLDYDLNVRYQAAKWGVLSGVVDSTDPFRSTFAFSRDVIGYELQGFFERNANLLRAEVEGILSALLEPT